MANDDERIPVEERALEALFMKRLDQGPSAAWRVSRSVARNQAHSLYRQTLDVIENLHSAREILTSTLLAGSDRELTEHILNLRDPLGATIKDELLACGELYRRLQTVSKRA